MESVEENSWTSPLQSIPKFFAGRSIFITGGTGFIGKVVMEKLLRSCSDIDTIYLLMRAKKGKDTEERLQELTRLPLFDKLREERPNALSHLHVIPGDISELDLGMSPENWKLLQQRVSIVYHIAATVRFDEPLKTSVLMNVRGTREVLRLAKGMENLKIFVHTSTVYCNTLNKTIEERLYDPPMDWRAMLHLAETADDTMIQFLSDKIVGLRPNTYTFTKALAEQVINECRDQLPVVIVRPSIVLSAVGEPIQGWIDNFNGPMAIIAGGGKGILHTYYWSKEVIIDVTPVDSTSKSLIIASWLESQRRTSNLPVYNNTFTGLPEFSLDSMLENCMKVTRKIPFNDIFYYPFYTTTNYLSVYYLQFAFLHFLPALMVDHFLRVVGRKTPLMKLQRRVFIAFTKLNYFLFNRWVVHNHNFQSLERSLLPEDNDEFNYGFPLQNFDEYYIKSAIGIRRYLFKESDESLPAAHRHLSRLYVLHCVLCATMFVLSLWIVTRYSLPQRVIYMVFNFINTILIL